MVNMVPMFTWMLNLNSRQESNMKIELRDFNSGDINEIWTWKPNSLDEVNYVLDIEIGEQGIDGSYSFQLRVTTPEGLRKIADAYPNNMPDRAVLILPDYSWDNVLKRINGIIDICSRNNWHESIACLQRYFIWEYEDLVHEKDIKKQHDNREPPD